MRQRHIFTVRRNLNEWQRPQQFNKTSKQATTHIRWKTHGFPCATSNHLLFSTMKTEKPKKKNNRKKLKWRPSIIDDTQRNKQPKTKSSKLKRINDWTTLSVPVWMKQKVAICLKLSSNYSCFCGDVVGLPKTTQRSFGRIC